MLAQQKRQRHLRDAFLQAQGDSPLALLQSSEHDEESERAVVLHEAPGTDNDAQYQQPARASLQTGFPSANPPPPSRRTTSAAVMAGTLLFCDVSEKRSLCLGSLRHQKVFCFWSLIIITDNDLTIPNHLLMRCPGQQGDRPLFWMGRLEPSQRTMDAFAAGEALAARCPGELLPAPIANRQPPPSALGQPKDREELVAHLRHQLFEALAGGTPDMSTAPAVPAIPTVPTRPHVWSADEDRFLLHHCLAVMNAEGGISSETLNLPELTRAINQSRGAAVRTQQDIEARCTELLTRFLARLRARQGASSETN